MPPNTIPNYDLNDNKYKMSIMKTEQWITKYEITSFDDIRSNYKYR